MNALPLARADVHIVADPLERRMSWSSICDDYFLVAPCTILCVNNFPTFPKTAIAHPMILMSKQFSVDLFTLFFLCFSSSLITVLFDVFCS